MSEEERERLLEWLLANGGPVVRYRTAVELCRDIPASEMETMRRNLLAFPPVQQTLQRLELGPLAGKLEHLSAQTLAQLGSRVHGSRPDAFENALGRALELGLRAGMAPLDERLLPLMRIFRGNTIWTEDALYRSAWESLVESIFAWGVLRAGYPPDPAMQDYLLALLDAMHKIARDGVYDLYASEAELKGLPKAWAGKPILRQEIMAAYHLPLIHDLYLLAYLPAWMLDGDTRQKIDDIIHYVLDPRFQALPHGYGYAWVKERRTCYSWGWSPHLAGYTGFDWKKDSDATPLVQQMELMSRFPSARDSRWFQSALRHLEWFRTDSGTYSFPAHYLRDLPDGGYYVSGYGMGLGENRRKKTALEIESTFRMVKIRSATDASFSPILL